LYETSSSLAFSYKKDSHGNKFKKIKLKGVIASAFPVTIQLLIAKKA
jgi:hypothetical protein